MSKQQFFALTKMKFGVLRSFEKALGIGVFFVHGILFGTVFFWSTDQIVLIQEGLTVHDPVSK